MTYHQLTQEERYLIAAQRCCGYPAAQIAHTLGRHRSTITRELRRNATRHDGDYRAAKAHSYAVARRRRCRRKPHFSCADLALVAKLLRRKWSAVQVAGALRREARLHISHETIYRRIRWDKRAGGDLWRHTRIMSKFGRKRYRSVDSRGVLPGKRGIDQRPVEVELRQQLGHWEGDTVMGSDMRHCVLTLVERKTGYAIIKKLSARNKDAVTAAATRAIRRHCRNFKTLTLDNGTEFHDYAVLERRFPVTVYFAAPYHSWQRGSNENFNGLLRQYLPKGTCMRHVTQAQCDQIADDLNHRPRKRLDFDTPAALYLRN
ncbi:MAG: IS30 family transposase [Burkholderiales bacterium]